MKSKDIVDLPNDMGWNSSETAIGGMTCSEAGTFLTGMVSYYRGLAAAGYKDKDVGVAKAALHVLKGLVDIVDSPTTPEDIRATAEKKLPIALMAVGQALIISTSNTAINPSQLANLTGASLASFIKLVESEKEKVAGGFVDFAVRLKGGKKGDRGPLEVGLQLTPMSEIIKKFPKEELRVVDEIVANANKPLKIEQGDN